MKVHPGMPLLAALLIGCAAAPPVDAAAAPRASAAKAAPKRARHVLHVVKPNVVVRPSEHEAVVTDAPDPEAQQLLARRLAEPAAPLDVTGKPPRVTELALADTARGEAPDMTALGGVASATLKEGQRAMMPVTLAPGECATFIAEGGLGVIEVDLFLLAADRSAGTRVLAQDPGTGPIGVVGGGGHCYRNPQPTALAAELHATVRRGAGVVLLRGYKK